MIPGQISLTLASSEGLEGSEFTKAFHLNCSLNSDSYPNSWPLNFIVCVTLEAVLSITHSNSSFEITILFLKSFKSLLFCKKCISYCFVFIPALYLPKCPEVILTVCSCRIHSSPFMLAVSGDVAFTGRTFLPQVWVSANTFLSYFQTWSPGLEPSYDMELLCYFFCFVSLFWVLYFVTCQTFKNDVPNTIGDAGLSTLGDDLQRLQSW